LLERQSVHLGAASTIFHTCASSKDPNTLDQPGFLPIKKLIPNNVYAEAPSLVAAFRQAWDRLRTRANKTDLIFHDPRHEAISRMFNNGIKIHEVMAVSGHRAVGQLFRYAQMA
jgi:integrase